MQLSSEKIVAKTKVIWEESFSEFPFTTHEVKIHFYKDSTNKFTLTGTEGSNGTDHKFTYTQTVASGEYKWQAIAAEKTGDLEETQIDSGVISILPNLGEETDPRSYWTQVYEKYKTAYLALSGRETESVSVLGQTVTYANREQLVKLMNHAKAMADKENGVPGTTNRIYKSRFR